MAVAVAVTAAHVLRRVNQGLSQGLPGFEAARHAQGRKRRPLLAAPTLCDHARPRSSVPPLLPCQDKITHVTSLHAAGLRFRVLPGAWAVHRPHALNPAAGIAKGRVREASSAAGVEALRQARRDGAGRLRVVERVMAFILLYCSRC